LYGLAAGDLTGDGKPELVVTNSGNTSSLIILGNISTLGGPVHLARLQFLHPRLVMMAPAMFPLQTWTGMAGPTW
jgi:hypothetical protein